MSIIAMDSCQYLDTTYLRKRWTAGDATISTSVYRHGSRSATFSTGNDTGFFFSTPGVGDYSELYLGASIYCSHGTLANGYWYDVIMGLCYNATGIHAHLNFTSLGEIKVYSNWSSTPIGTSIPGIFSNYTWHYIELYVKCDPSAGEVRVWVDDTLRVEATGVDTVMGSNTGMNYGCFNAQANHWTVFAQDIYVSTTRLGPCKVSAYDVDSDGAHTDWAALGAGNHYAEVDDATPDGDSSYNEGDAVGEKDSYGVTAETLETVHALQVRSFVKRSEDISVGKFRHFVRQNGSDYDGSLVNVLSGAYDIYTEIWETDPDDSNPWTQTKIESAEYGLEVTQLGTTTTTTT